MKEIRSLPKDNKFFSSYAKMVVLVVIAGYIAQIISALTEVTGIYTLAYSSVLPIAPTYAIWFAGLLALLGTGLIEFGLRRLVPHCVDAVLFRRFKGMYLAMTVAIFPTAILLLASSGILSFKNSQVIVEQVAPEAEQQTTAVIDSVHLVQKAEAARSWSADSTTIVASYATQIEARAAEYTGKIKAAKRELSNVYNRERRTGQSYATAKDQVRQKLADLEAEQAVATADLWAAQAKELSNARLQYKEAETMLKRRHTMAADSILALNQSARDERSETVSAYGGGLGYFTIACLIVFVFSVIIERIHRKGSGIEETVEVSQYDINPTAWLEGITAVRERVQYFVRSRIQAFADKTPPAPLPGKPNELYDPTQVPQVTINLQLDPNSMGNNGNTIYIEPKRRQIGFNRSTQQTQNRTETPSTNDLHTEQSNENPSHTNTQNEASTHGNSRVRSRAVNQTRENHENMSLSDILQRLKDYKKRVGKHEQKKRGLEKAGKPVPNRTLSAIENNRKWVDYYTQLANQAQPQKPSDNGHSGNN
ncbi:hypothetical protein [Phaeodactylibacter xiamenensis]|uniref:hypothetical protein n=1 Tax=Phaeodactylibacter xiamenensis TaxID=1524460 RepID=UPI003CCB86A2